MPHTMVSQRHVGVKEAPQRVCGTLWVSLEPVISRPVLSESIMRAHGCRRVYRTWRTKSIIAKLCLSACINKVPGCGPQTHDDAHGCATGRTAGREPVWEDAWWRRASAGLGLHDHEAEGGGRDGTAGMEKAEVADFHEAVWQDMLEEPADKRYDVKVRGA